VLVKSSRPSNWGGYRVLPERIVACLAPHTELSRGYLQRIETAAARDVRRRDRFITRLLRSGRGGLAAAVTLAWSVASVNRALDRADPRPAVAQ
jgi:hypothetical protein